MLEDVARDLRYGFRGLLRTPAFTAVAVLSLAFGIGATTAIFSVVDAMLWRTLPILNPQELALAKCGFKDRSNLSMSMARNAGGFTNVFSWRAFLDIRSRSRKLSGAFGLHSLGGGQRRRPRRSTSRPRPPRFGELLRHLRRCAATGPPHRSRRRCGRWRAGGRHQLSVLGARLWPGPVRDRQDAVRESQAMRGGWRHAARVHWSFIRGIVPAG